VPIHGILLLDKPLGLSSSQAVQRVKRLLGADKAGHTGSLDPLASGMLPLVFGEATKIAGHLLGSRKAYAARVQLGATTTTDDAEGAIVAERALPALDASTLDRALARFVGRIRQRPPAYSAIKQGGVPLYRRARRGESVEVPEREVEVHALRGAIAAPGIVELELECGSGTYVRSLARDLGEALGCGAHLAALRRLWVEPFRDAPMITPETLAARLEQGGDGRSMLLPLAAGLQSMPALGLDESQARRLGHGQTIAVGSGMAAGLYRVHDARGRLIALAELTADGLLKARRGINPALV
jgi:tRNA pseudouridine55 synthase